MDKIFENFLMRQHEEVMALATQSDLIDLMPLDAPPQHYLARFRCKGLVRSETGSVAEADEFHVGIWLPDGYLREVEPFKIVTWFDPPHAFHPQIRPPWICLGRLTPGMSVVEIVFQVWEVITYRKVTMREDDALNREACVWARHNLERFPVDPRPLRRRSLDFTVEPVEAHK